MCRGQFGMRLNPENNGMSGEEIKQPVCNCGKVLTAEEILYYGTTCEQCEEAFTVAMQNDAMSECPIGASCSKALNNLKEAEYLWECAYVAAPENSEMARRIGEARSKIRDLVEKAEQAMRL